MTNTLKKCTEENIIQWLEDKSPNMEQQSMTCLYTLFYERVKSWVLQNKGSEIDAQDSLTEALFSFVRCFREGKYSHEGKLEPFFMRIAKNKFFDICRKRKSDIPSGGIISIDENFPGGIPSDIEWTDPLIAEAESQEEIKQNQKVEKCLNKLSESCKDRLVRFYYMQQSHKDIARDLGDSSEAVSKVMKNKCEKN
ncbi:MAG: sigma-70 family RNA polymerase sigma factor [Saprospiraceae bacterium]|nr:sigma-70 family RNA polymerase sigma factor [Saprospiraceae bacterium]